MSDATWRCPGCGATGPEAGFFLDHSAGGRGELWWASGEPEPTAIGGIKAPGQTWHVRASRCVGCGRLELFATHPG